MRATNMVLLAGLLAAGVVAGAPFAESTAASVPLSLTQSVPCANDGAGELVQLTGQFEIVNGTTFDAAGGAHLHSHINPQGVSGTGLSSGTSYRGTGVTTFRLSLGVGAEQTYVNNFLLIGAGGAPNLRVHENLVFVLSATGQVTAVVENVSVTCA